MRVTTRLSVLLGWALSGSLFSQQHTALKPELDSIFENPAIQEINRMPMRSHYWAFETTEKAKNTDYKARKEQGYNQLADIIRENVDMEYVYRCLK